LIFFQAFQIKPDLVEVLEPRHTPLEKVLQQCGLDFQTWDFTHDECEIWEKVLRVSEELKDEYEAEGNIEIYQSGIAEARPLLEVAKSGRIGRYLYLVQ
jgi:hypothetical protein